MADPLEEYRTKRDFRRTAEPSGKSRRGTEREAAGGRFVVHKHGARRLHYDLRLEHGGVLWSWAVTRGPSLDPAERRLAVHVEDHPLDYAGFEGVIPEGSYGAGAVIVWDEGEWQPDGDPAKGMKKGHLQFELHGSKLRGVWHLVRLKPRPGEKGDNWLLIKSDDDFADTTADILETEPRSVKSAMTLEEVGGGKKARKSMPKRARRGTLPPLSGFIAPALATLRDVPPSSDDWLHEVKFDGYRLQAHVADGQVRYFTRSGLDWTEKFGTRIADAFLKLDLGQAIIDGELVVLSDKGVAAFSLLQGDLSEGRTERMVFYAFDLLHLDDEALVDEPLIERKDRLEKLLAKLPADAPLRYSEHFRTSGETFLAQACRMGLEGVVSKRLDAPYRSGRSLAWLKAKCTLRQEFIVVGYHPSSARGRDIRSILVAYRKDGKLVYGGKVGTGFSNRVGEELAGRLSGLTRAKPAIAGLEKQEKGAIWVRPDLVAEVEFRAWTGDGILRQASFQGLRDDKPAAEIIKEEPATPPPSPTDDGGAGKPASTSALSHPEKVLWPEAGVTKKDLLAYYETAWPQMQPFIVNRPLSLVRAPDGVEGQRFFQKHASPGMPAAIRTLTDPADGEEHLYITDLDGLAALVQLGTVELHIWGARIDALETPDQFVFDLDPAEDVSADALRRAVLEIRDRLVDLGFAPFVKTSGGKGFHVVAPLKPVAGWDEVKAFTRDFADALAQGAPDRFTATMAKKARTGRIFIDYLRNGRGSTTVAPWSSRAKPGATISAPVAWRQVEKGIAPTEFTTANARKALNGAGARDWADFFNRGKPLRRVR